MPSASDSLGFGLGVDGGGEGGIATSRRLWSFGSFFSARLATFSGLVGSLMISSFTRASPFGSIRSASAPPIHRPTTPPRIHAPPSLPPTPPAFPFRHP